MHMFDALLSGGARFPCTDSKRHMPNYRNVFALRLIGNGEVRLAGEPVVDLNEIRPVLLLLFYNGPGLIGIAHRDLVRPAWRIAINDGTCEIETRAINVSLRQG